MYVIYYAHIIALARLHYTALALFPFSFYVFNFVELDKERSIFRFSKFSACTMVSAACLLSIVVEHVKEAGVI